MKYHDLCRPQEARTEVYMDQVEVNKPNPLSLQGVIIHGHLGWIIEVTKLEFRG